MTRLPAGAPALVAALLAGSAMGAAPDWLITPVTQPATIQPVGNNTIVMANGLVTRVFQLHPFGCVDYYSQTREASLLRSIGPEAIVTLDSYTYFIGDALLDPNGAGYSAYLNRSQLNITTNASAWSLDHWYTTSPSDNGIFWQPGSRGSPNTAAWPPRGATFVATFKAPLSAPAKHRAVSISVVYELYEGVPMMTKWLTINSTGSAAAGVLINSTVIEWLELNTPYAPLAFTPYPPSALQSDVTSFLYVTTDEAHGTVVSWQDDVNVDDMPGAGEPVLNVTYTYGPGVFLQGVPNATHPADNLLDGFEGVEGRTFVHPSYRRTPMYRSRVDQQYAEFVSFRAIEILTDTNDAERFGLSVRMAWRILAPWTLESPMFFHATDTTTAGFQLEVDQLAEMGWDMLIYSFGTNFNLETYNATYLANLQSQIAYANSKGIEVGGYDLIILQRGWQGYGEFVGWCCNTALPEGTPGWSPLTPGPDACMASNWYDQLIGYMENVHNTAHLIGYETDGPYGGSVCGATNHTHHQGLEDSVYHATKLQNEMYAWMRALGGFVNAPDSYYFQGSQKQGYGYNENQYSLPRLQDLAVSRAGLYTQTYRERVTMGWSQVPLVDYHAGGDGASFEPLYENLADYDNALALWYGSGIQACWRGYRLYDVPATQSVVKYWSSWFQAHRAILTSDIIHIRRSDMQDIDAFMHANAFIPEVGMVMVYNPTDFPADRQLAFPLYYTGISAYANITEMGSSWGIFPLTRNYSVTLRIQLPARTYTWFLIQSADGMEPAAAAQAVQANTFRPATGPDADGYFAPWQWMAAEARKRSADADGDEAEEAGASAVQVLLEDASPDTAEASLLVDAATGRALPQRNLAAGQRAYAGMPGQA